MANFVVTETRSDGNSGFTAFDFELTESGTPKVFTPAEEDAIVTFFRKNNVNYVKGYDYDFTPDGRLVFLDRTSELFWENERDHKNHQQTINEAMKNGLGDAIAQASAGVSSPNAPAVSSAATAPSPDAPVTPPAAPVASTPDSPQSPPSASAAQPDALASFAQKMQELQTNGMTRAEFTQRIEQLQDGLSDAMTNENDPTKRQTINAAIKRLSSFEADIRDGKIFLPEDNANSQTVSGAGDQQRDPWAQIISLLVEALTGRKIEEQEYQVSQSQNQETPAPTQETPAPTQETPAPTQETPAPTQETPAPTQETPAPTQETPAPTQETPAPTQETPAPTQETPAPTQETLAIESYAESVRKVAVAEGREGSEIEGIVASARKESAGSNLSELTIANGQKLDAIEAFVGSARALAKAEGRPFNAAAEKDVRKGLQGKETEAIATDTKNMDTRIQVIEENVAAYTARLEIVGNTPDEIAEKVQNRRNSFADGKMIDEQISELTSSIDKPKHAALEALKAKETERADLLIANNLMPEGLTKEQYVGQIMSEAGNRSTAEIKGATEEATTELTQAQEKLKGIKGREELAGLEDLSAAKKEEMGMNSYDDRTASADARLENSKSIAELVAAAGGISSFKVAGVVSDGREHDFSLKAAPTVGAAVASNGQTPPPPGG